MSDIDFFSDDDASGIIVVKETKTRKPRAKQGDIIYTRTDAYGNVIKVYRAGKPKAPAASKAKPAYELGWQNQAKVLLDTQKLHVKQQLKWESLYRSLSQAFRKANGKGLGVVSLGNSLKLTYTAQDIDRTVERAKNQSKRDGSKRRFVEERLSKGMNTTSGRLDARAVANYKATRTTCYALAGNSSEIIKVYRRALLGEYLTKSGDSLFTQVVDGKSVTYQYYIATKGTVDAARDIIAGYLAA